MFRIKEIFNVFSKRNKTQKEIDINLEVRNRILMLIMSLSDSDDNGMHYRYGKTFDMERLCREILKILMMRLGKFNIIHRNNDIVNGIAEFLVNCKGEVFLDFIEDCFKSDEFKLVRIEKKNEFIDNINYIFSLEDIKFELTKYKEYWIEDGMVGRLDSTTYPQIICKEDMFINDTVIKPALELLMDDTFKNANNEFLEGLTHYKKKRYKESIVSCCCALESVMKIISSMNKWKYNENATGLPLIKNIIEQSQSPSWYEGIIMPTLTLRNKLGPHGKGTAEVTVSKAQAQLQINLVASQVIFLIEEYNK
ncbi:DUF7014 domain-containing protein [Clostridium saccharoperbutylacetonicum]|uniref:DUF7014 domain-containing protein n=1 Tax=Clostridium saccharoperbutylacetonicum TaxID=36745 RepID=UPI0039EB89C8